MQDNYNNNQDKDNLKDIVGNTLHNFEADPPAGLWNNIEAGLQKRRRHIMLLRTTSIAASLLLLIGLGITWFTTDLLHSSDNKIISERTTTTREINYHPETSTGNKETKPSVSGDNKSSSGIIKSSTDNIKSSSGKNPDNNTQQQGASKKNKIKVPLKNSERKSVIGTKTNIEKPFLAELPGIEQPTDLTELQINKVDQPTDLTEVQINKVDQPTDLTEVQIEKIEQPIDLANVPLEIKLPTTINPVEPPASKSVDPSWSLAMGYGLSSGLDLTQNKEALTDDGSRYSHDDFTASLANGTSYFEEIENTIHDAPLALGITVDKRIARRLSVETGIMYTRLGFTVKTDDMSSFYRKYRNELYYLGIPVGLRYSFVERKRFDLYALQWLVLEKGVSGKWYVDTYTNNVITETESTNHTIRGIQLSTITGLGGEFKLAGKFYLFGQGGVQVFYLNETQPYNIRSSRVAWPSFQAGLRIGL